MLVALSLTLLTQTATPVPVTPNRTTAAVPHDADDPSIWVHPTNPSRSLIIATDKHELTGGLYVFDLSGKILQTIPNLDRPNNVDCLENIVVTTERKANRLRIYLVNPATRTLRDRTGQTKVFRGEDGERQEPMGIALYRRPSDKALFAFVSPKAGGQDNYLAQYRLTQNVETGLIDATLVRRFGNFSGTKEIESIAVDAELGVVYYSDETVGTRKYLADPDAPNANAERLFFNRTGTQGDHEGIAIWKRPDGTGYLVCTDQIEGNTIYRVFRREGNNAFLGAFTLGADETDGIEVTSANLGPAYPRGLMVAMNSKDRNFVLCDWRRIATALRLPL